MILYQVPELATVVIRSLNIQNISTSPVGITLYVVPAGEELEEGDEIFSKTVAAKQSIPVFDLTRVALEEGDTLRAVATIKDSLTVHGSGAEIT